jgi:hypothetical protein
MTKEKVLFRLVATSVVALALASTAASAQVGEAPPLPPGPPPLGWIYAPYTVAPGVVNVDASGLNVRTVPNGLPVMALTNGTPFTILDKQGDWFLIAQACDLTPTFVWSWTAPVQLFRCWVW